MKALRQLCAASVLTLALALSAFAGEIQTPRTSPEQPTKQGEIQTGVTGQIDTMRQATATEIALSLLQSMLSLL